ncbi:MAG TPA: hypothetical protein EYQ50_22505 [Verrucomicrobiales bacterium]|jgi:hypothetical protein|nr:hypothetical protein [Verrucomicrobiales bacterium]HIL69024.1 hypothetical protein [Verrucomicrobiota bacterium]
MKPQDLEKHIAKQHGPTLPSEWRSEILTNASAYLAVDPETLSSECGWAFWIWRELISPLRQGWTALAAIWVLLITVQFLSSNEAGTTESKTTAQRLSFVQIERGLNEQRQLLVELLDEDLEENPNHSKGKDPALRRRSQATTPFRCV